MTDLIPVPQPPLTPEQIAVGKDVEIRRLTAQIDTLTTVSHQYVDELATARARVLKTLRTMKLSLKPPSPRTRRRDE